MENQRRKITKFECVMYIASIIVLAIAVLMIISAITYIKSYFSSYGMSISSGWKDALQYVLSNSGSWFVFSLIFFAAGRITARLESIKAFGKPFGSGAPKAPKAPKTQKPATGEAKKSEAPKETGSAKTASGASADEKQDPSSEKTDNK